MLCSLVRNNKCIRQFKDCFYFQDAGSNIGAFTIPVASMKRKVIAVDLMIENLAFIKKSLSFANLTKYVHLVNRAIRFGFWVCFDLSKTVFQ